MASLIPSGTARVQLEFHAAQALALWPCRVGQRAACGDGRTFTSQLEWGDGEVAFHVPVIRDREPILMRFPTLRGHKLSSVHTLAWRFTDDHDEAWTRRINEAKFGPGVDFKGPGALMGTILEGTRPVVGALIVPAISSSDEVAADGGFVGVVAQAIAQRGGEYAPDLLRQVPHDPLKTSFGLEERLATIKGAYSLEPGAERRLRGRKVLLVDDIVTTGSTLREMERALLTAGVGPSSVYAVCLAKAERRSYAKGRGHDLTNDHIPERYARIWDQTGLP